MRFDRFRAPIAISILPMLIAVAGCRGTEDSAPGEAASASSGPREGIVDLTITDTSGREEYTFARVGGVVADKSGRIYVADASSNDVRVFGPDGRFIYRIGRAGQGPGEFDGPCCLALRDDDRTLWVRDGGNARYMAFTLGDTSAAYRTAVRMAHTDVNRGAPLGFDRAGNLIDIGSLPRDRSASDAVPNLGRYHLDTAGRVVSVDTVTRAPNDSVPIHLVRGKSGTAQVTFYVYQPYGPAELIAHSPTGEWARGISSRYSIAWYGTDGRVVRTLERSLEAPALTATERASAEESIQRDMKRTGLPRGQMPYDIPSRKQPLRSLAFDQEGRLWVQHSVPEGAPSRADVYAPDGRFLYEVTWPRRTELTGASRGDLVYAVQRDSLDTPSIVRMKLIPKN
jgi:hypothetical protein